MAIVARFELSSNPDDSNAIAVSTPPVYDAFPPFCAALLVPGALCLVVAAQGQHLNLSIGATEDA
jgi:hypothetical protein